MATKTIVNPLPELKRGDFLLYGAKSWHDIASQFVMRRTAFGYAVHVEIYDGDGISTASRNGIGVNKYLFRRADLISVRRAAQAWNYDAAFQWFISTAKGQKYDWLGLLCFTYAVKQGSPSHMFCSEYATNFAREGGLQLIRPGVSADTVTPNDIDRTATLNDLWRRK